MDIEKALRILENLVDEAEIFYSRDENNEVVVKNGKIDTFKENISRGFGIRVIKDKRVGFCYSTKLNEEVLHKAVRIAKLSESDKFLSLPERQKYSEDIAKFVKELTSACWDYEVIPTYSIISFGSSRDLIYNTNGIEGEDKSTSIFCYLSTVAKHGSEVATGFDYEISSRLDIDFFRMGEKAAKLAKESLNAEKIEVLTTNLILKPYAFAELIENTLIPSLSAENVQRGRSLLAGKIGEKLFSDINITDDGILENGVYTSKFDGEGVARQRTKLVEKGVLKNYLYNTYTANKDNKKSTGNASRSYSSLPDIAPTNFKVSGKGKLSEEGLVVHGLIGAHTSNFVTGDFSVETRNAFLNGKPIKKAIISGNIYELLKKVAGFGKDYRQVSNVIAPSIEFEEIRVAG